MEEKIYYTDGSCRGNPGPGGWGVVSLDKDVIKEFYSGTENYTTNNRMELTAILFVTRIAAENPHTNYIIYSDSAYCVNAINNWMRGWAANGWKNSKNRTIENEDLIKLLWSYFSKPFFNVEVRKVVGHGNILGNELADRLATNNENGFKDLIKLNSLHLYYKIEE